MKVKGIMDWKFYENKMKNTSPFVIDYPICGGGEECITACPKGREIWSVELMSVSMFGKDKRNRLRPVMVHPELCTNCNICLQACPTGALRPKNKPVKCRFLTVLFNTVKLFFKKKYNAKFVFSKEHAKAFRRNNSKDL